MRTSKRSRRPRNQQNEKGNYIDSKNPTSQQLGFHLLVVEPWLDGTGWNMPTRTGRANLDLRVEREQQHEKSEHQHGPSVPIVTSTSHEALNSQLCECQLGLAHKCNGKEEKLYASGAGGGRLKCWPSRRRKGTTSSYRGTSASNVGINETT